MLTTKDVKANAPEKAHSKLKRGNINMSNTILNNVTFAYVKIAAPVNKYQSSDTEFTVDCIVSKAEAKAWNKNFPKQKAKEVDNAEFTEKFKMDLPFPEQDEQYVIKLKNRILKMVNN